MKKLLFTLFLSLLTLTMSAQIQRTFLGNTLGESTYAQVKANMAKKGYEISNSGNKDWAIFYNVNFAGYNCEQAYFYFSNDKFCFVSFILQESYLQDNLKETFNLLRKKLMAKYYMYNTVNEENSVSFKDLKTLNSLNIKNLDDSGKYCLYIGYSDNEILNSINKQNSDEL